MAAIGSPAQNATGIPRTPKQNFDSRSGGSSVLRVPLLREYRDYLMTPVCSLRSAAIQTVAYRSTFEVKHAKTSSFNHKANQVGIDKRLSSSFGKLFSSQNAS